MHHTHTCAHTRAHPHVHTHTCAHTHVHTHMCTPTHVHTHTCTPTCAHPHMCTHTCAHTHVHTHTCAPTHVHTHTCAHPHMCTHTCIRRRLAMYLVLAMCALCPLLCSCQFNYPSLQRILCALQGWGGGHAAMPNQSTVEWLTNHRLCKLLHSTDCFHEHTLLEGSDREVQHMALWQQNGTETLPCSQLARLEPRHHLGVSWMSP